MSKKNNLTLVGLNNQDNDLFGGFGDDHLTGGTNAVSFTTTQNILVGDAQNMLAFEKGGGDTLIGGNSSTDDPNVFQADVVNILFGDAAEGMFELYPWRQGYSDRRKHQRIGLGHRRKQSIRRRA